MQKILIIEDDADISELISSNLRRNGFDTFVCHDGLDGLEKARTHEPDLIVLDLMMPGMNGITVTKELKKCSQTRNIPVLILTAKAELEDRILGLESGADDYLTKPFSPKEMVLRCKSILKRVPVMNDGLELEIGPFRFVKNALKFYLNGQQKELTLIEFKLMIYLCERANITQDRRQLLQEVWGYSDHVHSRTLDTHMKRLRKKLENYASCLETIRGVGYRINSKNIHNL